jgi:photosystem II stability/assembly factor-like uncharacterized protein
LNLWCAGPGDVWAVGRAWATGAATIRHWEAGRFTESRPGDSGATLNGVWAGGPDDVWAVGEYGTVVRGNDSGWTSTLPINPLYSFHDVSGTPSGEMWVVGDAGMILHRNP